MPALHSLSASQSLLVPHFTAQPCIPFWFSLSCYLSIACILHLRISYQTTLLSIFSFLKESKLPLPQIVEASLLSLWCMKVVNLPGETPAPSSPSQRPPICMPPVRHHPPSYETTKQGANPDVSRVKGAKTKVANSKLVEIARIQGIQDLITEEL